MISETWTIMADLRDERRLPRDSFGRLIVRIDDGSFPTYLPLNNNAWANLCAEMRCRYYANGGPIVVASTAAFLEDQK